MTAVGWDPDGWDGEHCDGPCCHTAPRIRPPRRPGLLARIRSALRPRRPARYDARVDQALAAACCEPWWTSCGIQHDLTCPNQHRSAA